MKKYRKKPVVIEAVQWTGSNEDEVLAFFPEVDFVEDYCIVQTLEGDMRGMPGDWIIRGVSGEYYPCKPGIFEATYEEVIDDETPVP